MIDERDEKITEIKVKSEFGCHECWVTIQGDWNNVKIVHDALNVLEIEYQKEQSRIFKKK